MAYYNFVVKFTVQTDGYMFGLAFVETSQVFRSALVLINTDPDPAIALKTDPD